MSTATADVEGCCRLLESVADELKAEQAVLILCNPLTRELEFVVHNQDPALPKLYADYYSDLDPTRLPDFVRGRRGMPGGSDRGTVVSDLMDVVDYRGLLASEFYNDFMKRGNIHYDLVAFMSGSSLARGALCLHRARGLHPFSPEEVSVLELLAPFVSNHLEKMVSATVLSVLQTSEEKGVIVCDPRGRVLFCNELARDLCLPLAQDERAPGGVEEIYEGSRSLLHENQSATPPTPVAGVASFVGYALSDPEALAKSCNLGVSSRTVEIEGDRPGLLITLEPSDGHVRDAGEPLKERFALTDREIEVLDRAMAGGSNREIAQALFIAECTVKKHMHSIAAKVGVRSRTAIAHAVRQEVDSIH
jgi:DNA-binding CsgD family transcriptional regulator